MKITVKKTKVVLELSNPELEGLADLVEEACRARRRSPVSWLLKPARTILFYEQLAGVVAAMGRKGLVALVGDEEAQLAPAYTKTRETVERARRAVRPTWKGQKGTQARVTVEASK